MQKLPLQISHVMAPFDQRSCSKWGAILFSWRQYEDVVNGPIAKAWLSWVTVSLSSPTQILSQDLSQMISREQCKTGHVVALPLYSATPAICSSQISWVGDSHLVVLDLKGTSFQEFSCMFSTLSSFWHSPTVNKYTVWSLVLLRRVLNLPTPVNPTQVSLTTGNGQLEQASDRN